MRFAAVIPTRHKQLQPPQRNAASELIRRIVTGRAQPRPPADAEPQEHPADLDQRVRLIGEW